MLAMCCHVALVLVGIAITIAAGALVLTVYGIRLMRAAIEELIGGDRAQPPRRGGVH